MPQLQVHKTLHNTARMVVLRHPSSFDALCFKKIYLQEEGNLLGGVMVLGGEDVAEIDFQELGMAKVLFVEQWQASSIISENDYANDNRIKLNALIEPDLEDSFTLEKGDLFYLQINDQVGLAYEIVGIEIPIGIPTAMNAKRYVLNKRDDLDYIDSLPKEKERL